MINKKKIKILVMGLPGAGKTTLAEQLVKKTNAVWLNADDIRKKYDDWDFSELGRARQARRMKNLSDQAIKENKNVVADFVCPTPKTRADFEADLVIWLDTIKKGRFEDTNKMFVPPKNYDLKVTTKDAAFWVNEIMKKFFNE